MKRYNSEEVADPMKATRQAFGMVAAAVVATSLVACTEPGVNPKPPALQESASNLRDWEASAARMVDSMAAQGFIPAPAQASRPPPPPGRIPFPGPYFVNVTAQGSTFLEVIRQSLERELLLRNLQIARSPIGATVINVGVDVVHWGSGVSYPGGILTAAGLAGVVGTGIASAGPLTAMGWAVVGAGAATAADVGISMVPDSRTEVVWRVSVLSNNRVMMSGRELLYVSASDIPFYIGNGTSPPASSPGTGLLGQAQPLKYAR